MRKKERKRNIILWSHALADSAKKAIVSRGENMVVVFLLLILTRLLPGSSPAGDKSSSPERIPDWKEGRAEGISERTATEAPLLD